MPSAIDYLISMQQASGGWGYKTGYKPVVEPTAAVLLAVRNEPNAKESFQSGITWLSSCQHQDGGWGINDEDDESGWQTAWALIALQHSDISDEAKSKAQEWLLGVDTLEITRKQFLGSEKLNYQSLIGAVWPWLPGQAGWVEPTALAMLAIQNLIPTNTLAENRVRVAIDYFHQYRTPDGGWNIGNANALDTIVIPRAYPTALVLLALAFTEKQDGQKTEIARLAKQATKPEDLSGLRQDLSRDDSILARASGLLALRTLGENDGGLYSFLSDRQLTNGSWENSPFSTAWAMMALRGYW